MDAEKHLQFKVTSKRCSDRAKKQPEALYVCAERFSCSTNMQTGLSCRILNYTTPLKNRTIFLFCFYTEYIKPLMANFPVSS